MTRLPKAAVTIEICKTKEIITEGIGQEKLLPETFAGTAFQKMIGSIKKYTPAKIAGVYVSGCNCA